MQLLITPQDDGQYRLDFIGDCGIERTTYLNSKAEVDKVVADLYVRFGQENCNIHQVIK